MGSSSQSEGWHDIGRNILMSRIYRKPYMSACGTASAKKETQLYARVSLRPEENLPMNL
jgi:hypothetical protein